MKKLIIAATFLAVTGTATAEDRFESIRSTMNTCAACHGVDGKGVPGIFPPLDGAAWAVGDPERMTKIVLHGLMGELEVKGQKYNNVMAPLGATLDDQQIADVLSFVRQNWSNDASSVSVQQVSKVRKKTTARKMMYQPAELQD